MMIFQKQKPILLILHGWQSSKERWQRVKEEIEKAGIKVIVPDLPGFKKETELKRPWNLDDYVEWVKRSFFIDRDSLPRSSKNGNEDKIFLLGHSFGGRVALKFTLENQKKLAGLILVSAGGVEKADTIRNLKKRILKKYSQMGKKFSFLPGYNFFRDFFYRRILRKTDYLEAKGFLKETFKNVLEEDLTSLLKEIKLPTLILWGKKDKVLPLRDGCLMKEKIPNSQLEVLKDSAHSPHLDNPKFLSQKIIDFVKKFS